MKKQNQLAVGSLAVCSMLLLNGCAGMGGGPVGAAIGHMIFGAAVALAAVFGYQKLKK